MNIMTSTEAKELHNIIYPFLKGQGWEYKGISTKHRATLEYTKDIDNRKLTAFIFLEKSYFSEETKMLSLLIEVNNPDLTMDIEPDGWTSAAGIEVSSAFLSKKELEKFEDMFNELCQKVKGLPGFVQNTHWENDGTSKGKVIKLECTAKSAVKNILEGADIRSTISNFS